MIKTKLIFLLIALLMIQSASSPSSVGNTNLISDGILDQRSQSDNLSLEFLKATNITCEPTYGFLPCTTKVWGQLFLLVVYEYMLSVSEWYISRGSNLFFEMFGTGIFGASLFHMLGNFPQVIIVLVSGITGSDEDVESVSAMAMGLLAGSAILSLTIVWGSIVAFGSYNLSATSPNVGTKNRFSLTGNGVMTDCETQTTGRVMLLSIIPLLLLQLAKILNSSSATRVVVLATLIISVIFLIIYCTYQVFQPWIQSRRLAYLIGRSGRRNFLQTLCNPIGKPDEATISELFKKIDQNNNTKISAVELRAFLVGIHIQDVGLDINNYVSEVLEAFDGRGNTEISETEFIQGLLKWLTGSNLSARSRRRRRQKRHSSNGSNSNSNGNAAELQRLVDRAQKAMDALDPVWWNYTKAGFMITLGTAITFVLAQPLMETISNFSTAINMPSFVISYIVIPMALTFRQGHAAITSAKAKTEQTVSLALSEIYGGVFMNNVLGLASFLFLVYVRDLAWDVSAQVLVVLIICSLMGLSASICSKFPIWSSIIAYALYPISLAFLYVLTTVLGWG